MKSSWNRGRVPASSSSLRRPPIRAQSYLVVFAVLAVTLILAHGTLLAVPFYWDEIGQFVPASLDLYQTGTWIPHTTLPNVHPPGVMAYLTLVWKVFGYSIEATRLAMLLVAAAGALAAFLLTIELCRGVTGTPAFVAILMLCISPLFFSQSMMVLLDMPAMSLTVFALLAFVQNRFPICAALCVALVLVKETGIVAPAVFGMWLLAERRLKPALWFLLPLPALGAWLFALHTATGHWFGNAEFTQFNVWYPLNPVRLSLALLRRVYYLFISTGHIIGTVALVYAIPRMPAFKDRNWRILLTFAAAHIVAVCMLGGAVLERYLLPVLPLLYAAFAMSFQALLPKPRLAATAAILLALSAANFINPPYPFPFENNLAWTTFVSLEQRAAANLRVPRGRAVATAFPFADALRNQDFGFVGIPRRVKQTTSFRASDLKALQLIPGDKLVVFTQTWDPLNLLGDSPLGHFLHQYYGYEREATIPEIEQLLGVQTERSWTCQGFFFTQLTR